MSNPKGFGPPQKTQPFTLAILASPAPGAYEVAISCPHGRFVVTAWPEGIFLSEAQLPHIAPGCLRWLAKNRNAIGQRIYSQRQQEVTP